AAAHPERAPGARQQVHHAARPALRAEADHRAAAGQRGADDHAARRARRQSGGARGVPGERLLGDVGAAEGGRRELDARAAGGEDAVVSLRQYVWRELSEERRAEILRRPALADDARVAERVAAIIAQVRRGGDAALAELCESLDGVRLTSFEVAPAEHDAAADALTAEQRAAIEAAARNIETFHRAQLPTPVDIETAPGVRCEKVSRPIRRVGLYVPAGTAPLPSTALMLGIPARLAGCPTRVMCT